MSDTLARDRFRSPSSIRAILDAPAIEPDREGPDGPEEPGGLEGFTPDGTAYQAHARPGNKPLPSIHFILRDRSIRTCQYLHLESDSRFLPLPQGQGHRLVFRFAGSAELRVVVEGRNLWRLYDYIAQHRMAWVYELPGVGDFEDAHAAVVQAITFETVEPDG